MVEAYARRVLAHNIDELWVRIQPFDFKVTAKVPKVLTRATRNVQKRSCDWIMFPYHPSQTGRFGWIVFQARID